MAKIKTEKQYKAACSRIEELLKVVSNDTPTDDKNFLELDLISDLVADYEEVHFPIGGARQRAWTAPDKVIETL